MDSVHGYEGHFKASGQKGVERKGAWSAPGLYTRGLESPVVYSRYMGSARLTCVLNRSVSSVNVRSAAVSLYLHSPTTAICMDGLFAHLSFNDVFFFFLSL